MKAELLLVERESVAVAALLIDSDVLAEPMAKKAILCKSAEIETRRETLHATLGKILEKANEYTGRVAEVVRETPLQAKARWEAIADPAVWLASL